MACDRLLLGHSQVGSSAEVGVPLVHVWAQVFDFTPKRGFLTCVVLVDLEDLVRTDLLRFRVQSSVKFGLKLETVLGRIGHLSVVFINDFTDAMEQS